MSKRQPDGRGSFIFWVRYIIPDNGKTLDNDYYVCNGYENVVEWSWNDYLVMLLWSSYGFSGHVMLCYGLLVMSSRYVWTL